MSVRNFEEYRAEVLESLGEDYTVEDLRNEEKFRGRVLEGLGAEYTEEDTRNFERYRLKVLENLSGGGGGGDLTTATVTVNDSNELALLMKGAFPVEGTLIDEFPFIDFVAYSDEFGTRKVALYKGNALISFELEGEVTVTASGNAEVIRPGYVKITGDCTITIS